MSKIEIGQTITFQIYGEEHTLAVTATYEDGVKGEIKSGNPHLVGLHNYWVPFKWLEFPAAAEINPNRWYDLKTAGKFLASLKSPEGRSTRAMRALLGRMRSKKHPDGTWRVIGEDIIAFMCTDLVS